MMTKENFQVRMAPGPATEQQLMDYVEANKQPYLLASYSMMLVNDIACDAVNNLECHLKEDRKLYRHEVKRKYRILLENQRQYSRQFNKFLDREAQEYFADWSCNYWDMMEKDFGMLKQTWKNEMLRANCPDPYICAELNYVREVIEIAVMNYDAWVTELKKRAPLLLRMMSLDERNIEQWHKAYVNLSNQICYSLGIVDREINVNIEQLDLAKKICCQKIGNCEYVAKAVGWKEIKPEQETD